MADPLVPKWMMDLISDAASAAALQAVKRSGQVRFRPGTLAADTGYPVTTDVGSAEIPTGVIASVRLDGDSVATYAQNVTGEPFAAGTRVMCAFVPPHGCFVVGPIDHWPVERGLLAEVEDTGTDRSPTTTTLVEIDTGLRTTFQAPASGRVRYKWWGGFVSSGTGVNGIVGVRDVDLAADVTLFSGGTSVQWGSPWLGTAGVASPVHYERIASGLVPGEFYIWTPAVASSGATSSFYAPAGRYGTMRAEVWAMPPLPSAAAA